MRIAMVGALVCAIAVSPANAVPGALVIAEAYTYVPGGDRIAGGAVPGTAGPAVVAAGTDVLFVNLETLAPDVHSMTAVSCLDPTRPCWFDTSEPTPQAVGEAVIVPTASLAAGSYPFYCTVHPVMQGTLVVL